MTRTSGTGSIKLQHVSFTSYIQIAAGQTVYMTHGTLGAAIAPRFIMITHAGLLRNLYVRSHAPAGGVQSYVFTLMLNGAPTALTCTITGAGVQTANDIVNTVAVVPGDYVCMMCVASATANSVYISASCEEWSS